MKLIIVRHGQTEHNKTDTHVGQLDVALNSTGLQQAKLVGQRLAQEEIDAIYSSDLQRARATAHEIALHHRDLEILVDPGLRERNAGDMQGQPIKPGDLFADPRKKIDRQTRPTNGESINELKQRVTRWFTTLKLEHKNETVVVVGHGGFLYVLLEVAVEDGADVDREDFVLKNCGVTTLQVYSTGRARVIHLNDVSHLER